MKIAIIGAGPGGLYAALAAAGRNIRVDLFEKRTVGEGIVCGECIFDSLRIMPRPGRGLLRPVQEVILQGRKPYTFPLSRHRPLWMLDRKTWQQGLAVQARERGVAIRENIRVTRERLQHMQKEYDWVLDASGAPSITSRLYGFADKYLQDYMLAHQVVLAHDFSALMPRITFAFFDHVPAEFQPAYYWIFPKDASRANVGVVCTVKKKLGRGKLDLKKLLAEVLQKEGLTGARILARGSGIAAGRMLPRLVYDNTLLVGDAAGLTSPLHGGGIDMACLSGVLAVEAIAEGQSGVACYAEKLKDYLKEKEALEKVTMRKMKKLSFDQYDKLLRGVTAPGRIARLKTALRHPDMFYVTVKWFGTKKNVPGWPV